MLRRDLLLGAFCLAGAGGAYILTPKRRVSLLGRQKLADLVPRAFGDWTSRDVSDLIAPKVEGSLMSKLYSETIGRTYANGATGDEVMMLLAYGDTQSNDLQLHRPESCYPAFGFSLSRDRSLSLPLGEGVAIPARTLVAIAPGRQETIVYWSRLGEYLPDSGSAQRLDRIRTAMAGSVADGLLARFSSVDPDPDAAVPAVEAFIRSLIAATPYAGRLAMVGTRPAQALMKT